MTTVANPVRVAGAADTGLVGRSLASAFQDDPVFCWAIPDAVRRRAVLPGVFAAWAEFFLPFGASHVADAPEAATLWAPRGCWPDDEALGERVAPVLGPDAERLFAVAEVIGERHPVEPHHHLQFIGVTAESRGGGVGSALLATALERIDAAGDLAYLDATSPANKRFYERHGFRATEEYSVPDGPPLWSMWRVPRA